MTAKNPFIIPILFFLVVGTSPSLKADEARPPLGLPELNIPANNPITPEKVALGKKLYFDKRLSANDTISCATCHDPDKGFADAAPVSTGINGQKGGRSAPTTLNAAYMDTQFWDGRAPSLEEQAKGPIINPIEMGMPSHDTLIEKLNNIEEYRNDFQNTFGEAATIDNVAKAIASFERTLLSANSPFDRYLYDDDETAMTEGAKRGFKVFTGKGRCSICHEANARFGLFMDNKFHNLGVGMDKKDPDLGRYDVTLQYKDKGAFKTPTLRDIALTAPYMHDGSVATLLEVVEFYNKGGEPNPHLSDKIEPLQLTQEEKDDLVAFMESLTSMDINQLIESTRE
ncbi:MAG: cytochrome c peroxidase [Candidatus Brocadiales bacterium]